MTAVNFRIWLVNISMKLSMIQEAKETLTLVDLPYAMDALEPVMSKASVRYHYSVLSKGYVDRFNAGEGDADFNRAGAMLHNLFWPQLMPPRVNNAPKGAALDLIEDKHGSWADFRDAFIDVGSKFMGSGWAYMNTKGEIRTLKDQSWKNDVILPIDLWEHTYYMDYPADKKAYLRAIWRCINWDVINARLSVSVKPR